MSHGEHVRWLGRHARGTAVLDVGCDPDVAILLRDRPDLRVTGIGRDRLAVETARATLAADAPDVLDRLTLDLGGADWPYADASFDTVIVRDAVEHRLLPRKLFEEVRRVLRPDGVALVVARYGTHRHRDHDDALYLGTFFEAIDGLLAPERMELAGESLLVLARPGAAADGAATRAIAAIEERVWRLERELAGAREEEKRLGAEARRWLREWEKARARGDRYKRQWDQLRRNPVVRLARAVRHPGRALRRLTAR